MILPAEKIPQLLADLKKTRFYGLISFQFRDGEVTLVKREETFLTDRSNTQGRTARYDRNEH